MTHATGAKITGPNHIRVLAKRFPELPEETVYLLGLFQRWVQRLSEEEQLRLMDIMRKGSYVEEIIAEEIT